MEKERVGLREIARRNKVSLSEMEKICGVRNRRFADICRPGSGEEKLKVFEAVLISKNFNIPMEEIEYNY